jgi:hypothetical protein
VRWADALTASGEVKRDAAFATLLRDSADLVEALPAGAFKDAGTLVHTNVVRLRKPQ